MSRSRRQRYIAGVSLKAPSNLIGYARVSTLDQDPQLQLDALNAAGCSRVFVEHASGVRDRRPELERLLDHLRQGDVIVVWRLDRLGRSLRHLVDVITDLEARGVAFRSLTESVDTTTAGGRLTFHLFAALAEFERDLIRERTAAGLAVARSRGRRGGRPTVMTEQKLATARSMLDEREKNGSHRHSVAIVAQTIGVSRATLYRAVAPNPR